ncbi:nitrate reductase molybdenum cofactor assembly chaperone [Alkalibacillus salilacus]|uniref:Nitrate reductase delta subunit n=1 Tax=Alkalibacillus salilacus TaxID=284582 RepID=A0ABT9VBB6_9BACI|nr:nitrate reductase molybdenum cofactor assembly chaperone [Alkalibacillus salilacus]MDQ0158259.1 nitrate reductase delta subunit [Alkalibacillus salilacus]
MINLDRLQELKPSFSYFATYLSYPEESFNDREKAHEVLWEDHPASSNVAAFEEAIHHWDDHLAREKYIDTFDFEKDCALYMTYFKFEDSKERGQMLARLKVAYEMYGLDMPKGELSDYLPLMCEFIYAADWYGDERSPQSFKLLFAVLEDGTYHLLKALEAKDNPYQHLVKGLRETLKACVVMEEVEQT